MDLRKYVDKIKPAFEEGGKFAALHSTFDAFETFLYVPNTRTSKGSHVRDCNDLKRVMIIMVLALMPALIFGMFNVGYQRVDGPEYTILQNFWYGFLKVLPIIIVSYVVGLSIEFASSQIRKEEVNEGFLVTGMLIPMIVPVGTPLWMVALATAFSVVVCKEVFGGTGMNIFNPALVARAFIFFSYTASISGENVWFADNVDGHSGATALSQWADTGATQYSVCDALIGTIPGCIGETSTIAILLGALLLIATGVASWRIMLSVFAGGLAMGLVFNAIGANAYMQVPAWQHLIYGGFAFGAVFMATDPVTAAQTNTGKWIYGFMIGVLAVLIRLVNPGYPEGMMMAILFMNGIAPLIDHYVVDANIRRRNKRVKLAK
ncbi:MAG: NADH:ubiquinone reductase (Na(+)-transporting) subunit B [Rikenellaceae bacterium]|nr:NADH:ubiquinone reductase (Na(+)-transporting) subunit B [Rikenellaceae bacterium]